jgi:hypothetical protein
MPLKPLRPAVRSSSGVLSPFLPKAVDEVFFEAIEEAERRRVRI